MREDAPQREHSLRDLFNAARWVARAGIAWRMMPHDLPPWALVVTPADEQDRAQVAQLAQQVQQETGEAIQVAFVDQGYTGEEPAQAAAQHGIQLEVVKLPEAKKGFVLLPRRWVVERSFAWMARFRRLARDYERLPTTLAGFHLLASAILMLRQFVQMIPQSA